MAFPKLPRRPVTYAILALLAAVGAGLFWNKIAGSPSPLDGVSSLRRAEGLLFGRLPLPTEPTLLDPMTDMVAPKPAYKLMTIKHIPPVKLGTGMPHPYVGDCRHCHLTIGGAPAGSQYKTPVGAILESLSRVRKLGPPILPTSRQPHPPAGRCIKCHDIVVKVPLDGNSGVRWRL